MKSRRVWVFLSKCFLCHYTPSCFLLPTIRINKTILDRIGHHRSDWMQHHFRPAVTQTWHTLTCANMVLILLTKGKNMCWCNPKKKVIKHELLDSNRKKTEGWVSVTVIYKMQMSQLEEKIWYLCLCKWREEKASRPEWRHPGTEGHWWS